ncbi:CinA family protein [Proteobacteria bacterium 005FR1]|nr:CinA family protein [Proteobacteria bacterium 005FR1]
MEMLEEVVAYLKEHELSLATAESCTAGLVTSELARVPGSGGCLDCGLTLYSPESKNRYLKVSFETIEKFGLTSEEVAVEMAVGALNRNGAGIAVSNTGLAGPGPGDDGTPAGTVCFAWAISSGDAAHTYSETRCFDGERNDIRLAAAHYSLEQLPHYHQQAQKQYQSTEEGG